MPEDPRIREFIQTLDTIEYITKVLKENVIHGEEAIKTVGALQWLSTLGDAIRTQAQTYIQPVTEAKPNG